MTDVFVDVPGARLAATDSPAIGEEQGTIVALHAGVADRRGFTASTPTWTDAGWRVVSYDRRGFGTSTWDESDHDPVADLATVLADRAIDAAVLVGNSMGGALAIDFALTHPSRVRGLVLVGAGVSGQAEYLGEVSATERSLDQAIGAAAEAGELDEANRLECHYWLDGPHEIEGRVADEARSLFLDMNGTALAAAPTGSTIGDVVAWTRLAEIPVPTLAVVGALDEREVVLVGAKIAAEVPDAALIELDDRAHLPMLEDPAEFSSLVRAFLDRIERG